MHKPQTSESTKVLEIAPVRMSKRKIFFSRFKRRLLKHVWLVRAVGIGGILIIIFLVIFLSFRLLSKTEIFDYIGLARNFIMTPSEEVKSSEDRTNILILGKGGLGHDAPDLTDTIIFASINHKDLSLIYISIPRDIWIPQLRTKLNSIYYWGNQKEEGGGLILAKATVEELLGQPVHYGVVTDFEVFREIITIIGGIEIDVDNAFVDERYPIPGRENDLCDGDLEFKCRYETIRFEKGLQYMDADTALKYVRSRNAEGDEGSDFARASRQQKVVEAIKEKVIGKEVLLHPQKIFALKEIIINSVENDISPKALSILARRALQVKGNTKSFVLPEEFLLNPPKGPTYDNLYVFIPRKEDKSEIHAWTNCALEKHCGLDNFIY